MRVPPRSKRVSGSSGRQRNRAWLRVYRLQKAAEDRFVGRFAAGAIGCDRDQRAIMTATRKRRDNLPEFCLDNPAGGMTVDNIEPPYISLRSAPRDRRRIYDGAAAIK